MVTQPEIRITLPTLDQLKAGAGKIRVKDNGIGMTSEKLQLAVKAGYSGNDPVEKLGLFGMGFNIATARLGRRTEVWTITPEATEWTGLVIDFDELEKSAKFQVPRLSRPRETDELQVHGTEIVISKLDADRVRPLMVGRGKSTVMQKLGRIYSRLMQRINLEIWMDYDKVKLRPHCTWDISRRVETSSYGPVAAIQPIEEEIGPRPFCTTCWVWLAEGEDTCLACGSRDSVAPRQRVIRGWLGIQRFFHRYNYGIDLIRNGRVISELDKSMFYWENPSVGDIEIEYPIDTIHWGGRIVGELEIDFVRISHQKDAFDKSDPQWQHVLKAIRGDGPLRPDTAKEMGYGLNNSPLARLFSGYRKGWPPGLRHLVPGGESGKGINEECMKWANLFWAGDPDYQVDQKWYEAVLTVEAAKQKPPAKSREEVEEAAGEAPFTPEVAETEGPEVSGTVGVSPLPILEDDSTLSCTYEISEMNGSPILKIKARRLVEGQLDNEQAVRFLIRANEGVFEYNPTHEYFETSLDTPKNCLVRELSYQLLSRSQESQDSWPITRIDQALRQRYFSETLLNVDSLAEQAAAFLDELRQFLQEELPALSPVDESIFTESDRDIIRTRLIVEGQAGEETVSEIISSGRFPKYLGRDFLPRAIRTWPELLLDGRFLSIAYATVSEGIRQRVLDQVIGPIRDVVWLCEQSSMPGLNQEQWREQLARAASSFHLLQLWRA